VIAQVVASERAIAQTHDVSAWWGL